MHMGNSKTLVQRENCHSPYVGPVRPASVALGKWNTIAVPVKGGDRGIGGGPFGAPSCLTLARWFSGDGRRGGQCVEKCGVRLFEIRTCRSSRL